ncbi:MAG: hypothetical protein PUI72_01545, partial [Prevotellaceae bacterium]|nr:hypothetical protein [Prevotellaceae bacterium]MDY6198835.1 hypothetical protein [Prevotella sp.]
YGILDQYEYMNSTVDCDYSHERFSVYCLVDIKKKRNFAAYFYVDTIKYSVKQWFLNEKHI